MRIKKKTLWLLAPIFVILLGVGGYFYWQNTAVTEAQTETDDAVQTATVRRGNLIISTTGAGTVIAATEISLGFQSGGVLEALYVQIGDEVSEGDLLAELNSTTAEQNVLNAELQLTQAQLQIDGSGTEAGVSFNDINIEQARISLEEAQSTLDDLINWEPDEDDIAQAEASLASAEASYNAALGQEASSSGNIQIEQISVNQAERNLADAQAVYDTAYDPGRDWELNDPRRADALESERERAASSLLQAQENLTIAQTQYQSTISSTNRSSSTSAEANLLSAQIALETAMSGPTEDEIEAAETAVRQAQLAYQQALLNQETDKLSLSQAEINLASAQEELANTDLTSPLDGTILTIEGNVGEQVSAGTLFTLANLEQPLIELYLDESDLATVGVGYAVEVTFDALPDDLFTGEIILIDPQLTTEGGVTAIRAIVQLDEASYAKPQNLPVGLNATVEVIGGEANNALLVPVEAVREISEGQYAVFVMENGEPQLTFVEIGLMDFTSAEILSGLEQGDVVTTGLVETE